MGLRCKEPETTLGFIPSNTDLETDDLDYDLLEDSTDEVVSSGETQNRNETKLSRFLNSIRRGRFN